MNSSVQMIGQPISHYKIIEKVGEGGMGVVYKAEDARLERTVALKFLAPHLLQSDDARKRFLREAKAAASLDHPNICTVYEIGETEGQTFIAMAYLEGQTLEQMVRSGPFRIEDAADIAIEVARGLAAAHERGVVHRDIKPGNVLVTSPVSGRERQVKIMDFGLAQLAGGSRITKRDSTLGTVAYMSPEQTQGIEVDHRADLWALGVVLYEMICGQAPFKGHYDQAVLYSILNEQPEPLTSLRTGVPVELERIVNKCLAKLPGERYQTAEDLLADLRLLRRSLEAPVQRRTTARERAKTQPSIAVLPFVNMNRDEESEFLSDGITEDIIGALMKVEGLHVAARSSSFHFKGKSPNIQEIGRQLQVGNVLEGSVRRAGRRLRITAQLVTVANGYQIWSERYDRVMEDIFDIQDEISQAIVGTLRVKLRGEEPESLAAPRTESLKAYELCLRARYHCLRFTRDALWKCIELAEQAQKEDPDYADPYAWSAMASVLLAVMGWEPPSKVIPRAEADVQTGLRLDDSDPELHMALGNVRQYYEWDWPGAEEAFHEALALDPKNEMAHVSLAHLFANLGKTDQALSEGRLAIKVAPVSVAAQAALANAFLAAQDYPRAIEQCERAIEINPQYFPVFWVLGLARTGLGDYPHALEALERANSIFPGDPTTASLLGWGYGMAGRPDEARAIVKDLIDRKNAGYCPASLVARVYVSLGDNGEALRWLETALAERDCWMSGLKTNHWWEPLHSEPRFQALLKQMRFSD